MREERDRPYYVQAIPVPETPKPRHHPSAWEKTEVIGKPLPRVDAYERVSGSAVYPSDTILPDMLYGAILRCPHAHAKVLSVDMHEAEKMPGVRAVINGTSRGAALEWSYLREFKTKLFDPHCCHEGEEVAAVAAETPYQAWDAIKAMKVK
jgi:xanthine dehydrogenase YagR molybdenum-binding subunit